MIRITRKFRFSASHRLHAAELSADANRELYGKCNNPYGHGHNYEIEVTARGPVDDMTGRAVDLRLLERLVREHVVGPLDQKSLNADVAEFQAKVPTTENLAIEIYRRLTQAWRSVFPGEWPVLERVRIVETARNIFEIGEAHGQK
ncbi:MAG: 6-pyruvoyl tetrahydrobiopterin synthase [Acidobacteria bacterium]|nr:MAG: 6-pyruvoyl tetrahydrobiopterin synthase [Acidobacteriota bacterium]